jgi:hypothetical protein
MRSSATLLLLILVVSLAYGQSDKDSGTLDLSKLSSGQLKACQGNPKACGTGDPIALNDELAKRLGEYSTIQILT